MNRRITATICSMLMAAVLTSGSGFAEDRARRSLQLTWLNASEAFVLPFEALSDEVRSAFEPHDIDVFWKSTPNVTRQLRVLLLPVEPTVWNAPRNAMGITRGDVDESRTVYIFLPTVMRALGLEMEMRRMPTPIEKVRIAKALGRVISHEIFHALLFDRPHAEHGLMRERLTKQSLSESESYFSAESADALRDALADEL